MVTENAALGELESRGHICGQCGKPLKFLLRETYPEGFIFDGNCGDETHDVDDYLVPSGEVYRTIEEQIENLNRLSQNDLEDRVRYAIDAGLVNGMDYRSISREEIIITHKEWRELVICAMVKSHIQWVINQLRTSL